MLILILILTVVFATALLLLPTLAIRALARKKKPFYWTFNPANTFAIIVTEEDESGEGMSGSGNIVDLLHGVSGKVLDKHDTADHMEWELRPGDDPRHGWMYRALGVQSMRSIYRTPRLNSDVRMRFAHEEAKPAEAPHTINKNRKTKNVFYTGELTVVIKEADTADGLGINFEIDFAFERQFPVRTVLKLADSAAFLTSLVEQTVNQHTVNLSASAYIGGLGTEETPQTRANRQRLIEEIRENQDFMTEIRNVIGFKITSVSLRDTTMTEAQRRFLQLKVEAEKKAEATVITARGERDAQIARNDGDADRVERVIKEIARDPLSVSARWADAHEKNGTLTTVVYGGSNNVVVPVGGDMERKVKEK